MLDIGSWEFLIVIVIALLVVGPKDLPGLVRTVSQWIRRARELAREFHSGLDDMAREAELDKITDAMRTELDPDGVLDDVKGDIERSIEPMRTGILDDAGKPETGEAAEAGMIAGDAEGEAAGPPAPGGGNEAAPGRPLPDHG